MSQSTAHDPRDVYSEHSLPEFLYEPEPGVDPDHGPAPEQYPLMLRNAGRNFVALVGMFFVSLAAFVVGVTLFSVGVGTAVIMVGLVVLVGGLVASGATARATK